ncbi:MAG: SDR family NAD(P)-dependent oxidoreductase [Acidimicrobiales bacterium]
MGFEDKVALVTGGAGGIGGDLSRALAREGARVGLTDVDESRAKEIAGELGTLGLGMDVSSEDSVSAVVDQITTELGPIDMLFNVAGITGGHWRISDIPLEVFDKVLATNMRGMLVTTQIVVKQMIADSHPGVIVNVGSSGGFRPGGELFHYCISKAAVHGFTQAAAKEFAQYGIRVNAVAPGPVYTPMSAASMDDPTMRAAWESRIPLHRIADTTDVVDLMLFLASDKAKNMTGAIVSTDGGSTA